MKNKMILGVLLASLFNVQAFALDNDFTLRSEIKIGRSPKNSLQAVVMYPGRSLSGICSLAILTEQANEIADRLVVTSLVNPTKKALSPEIMGVGILNFKLVQDTYVDGIQISTKDGKSLAENFAAVLGGEFGRKAVVVAGMCQ